MLRSSWLKSLAFPRIGRSRTTGGTRSRRRPAGGFPPAAEVLEDRTLLSAVVVTTTKDSGEGSLRAAIEFANGNPGPDTISFNIDLNDPGRGNADSTAIDDVFYIRPLSALPALTDGGTTIDGRTQPAGVVFNRFGPVIVLDGSDAGAADGLTIASNDNVVSGFNIRHFAGNGISINGDRNWIAGNYIGTNTAGSAPIGNGGNGVAIIGSGNIIGTNDDGNDDAAEANLISGNDGAGVLVTGVSSIGNSIRGNAIDDNGGLGIDLGGDGVTPNDSAVPFVGAGTALNFDGGTDYASVPDNAALDSIEQTDVVTVEAWVNIHGWDYGWFSIFDKYEASTDNGWQLAIEKNAGIAFTTAPGQGVVSGFVPVLNEWTHVAVSYARSEGLVRVFVNGKDVFETPFSADILDTSGEPLYLSFNPSGLEEYNNGSIDELRIWNVARTQAEIQADMNHALTGSDPGLVGYWDFNEGSGVTFQDKTANHNDGTLADGSSRPAWVTSGAGLSNDSDVGPNRLQNFPMLVAAETGAGVRVVGDLNSTPETTFTLDFYAPPTPKPFPTFGDVNGVDLHYLGSTTVTTDAAGAAHFDAVLGYAAAGWAITATATDPNANTSEFSAPIVVHPDISGDYAYQGTPHVEQQPGALRFINEFGLESAGSFTNATQVVATDWGGLIGNIVRNDVNWVIEWENDSTWTASAPDISGEYTFNGTPHVEQTASSLRFFNERAGRSSVSRGAFLSATQVIALDWGGLVGNIVGNRIEWANGSVWTAGVPDISGDYTYNGPTRVEQSIHTLRFINERGEESAGHFLSPTQVVATDWRNLTGEILGGSIEWANGTMWVRDFPVSPARNRDALFAAHDELMSLI